MRIVIIQLGSKYRRPAPVISYQQPQPKRYFSAPKADRHIDHDALKIKPLGEINTFAEQMCVYRHE
jgi:hypothetical protein